MPENKQTISSSENSLNNSPEIKNKLTVWKILFIKILNKLFILFLLLIWIIWVFNWLLTYNWFLKDWKPILWTIIIIISLIIIFFSSSKLFNYKIYTLKWIIYSILIFIILTFIIYYL